MAEMISKVCVEIPAVGLSENSAYYVYEQSLLDTRFLRFVVNGRQPLEWDVNIMRPTEWGNPFPLPREKRMKPEERANSLRLHATCMLQDGAALANRVRRELKGKRLKCCCRPLPCHGDFLAWLANVEDNKLRGLLRGLSRNE